MFKVVLESAEHGREVFEFETLGEAIETVKTLYAESEKAVSEDGIERVVGLLVTNG